ncbi:hypothetical protein BRC64_03405 [Halobacteriales archaeon QH_10_67_22]|nr:MAG: hypothetical protein BRC64_03405 [Halobacteriales archaeon QH_10_67_22]
MKIEEFKRTNATKEGGERFQLENGKLLDIDLNGTVMAKKGSMVAFTGNIEMSGKMSAEGGITGMVKSAVSSEGTPVMEAEGQGHLYVADQGKKVQVLHLNEGQSISVNGDDVLAFEYSVDYEISTIGSVGGAQAGGLTNVFLTGPGYIAITTHGDPLVMSPPVKTDPDATVAWSANLSPSISKNKAFEIGSTSGETYQMDFSGSEGFVVVQPYEEGGQQQ